MSTGLCRITDPSTNNVVENNTTGWCCSWRLTHCLKHFSFTVIWISTGQGTMLRRFFVFFLEKNWTFTSLQLQARPFLMIFSKYLIFFIKHVILMLRLLGPGKTKSEWMRAGVGVGPTPSLNFHWWVCCMQKWINNGLEYTMQDNTVNIRHTYRNTRLSRMRLLF